ncbi:hypothetical protein HGO34_01635 [Agrobacterium vitis]|uniref:Uncharacterized protein n=1 Tax=Agrobacterium vitis TaxID=373 RepID=A0AAE4W921_AGRVI|nr:hypothetical protein [Agrobacterium vitis]MCF1498466.1 hypothetical protein [Allorhizobium sp. Av2]MCM2438416.1 hypothetical protein [Agrobacterium vitis]MUZ56202.1 hypothetical protein [Agrobacterium vitis]MVA64661.1 hypothetical protein [Agrobacterium vitis]MVA85632.1 hypothetical protein [Agrobacterium vitis]
MYVVPNGNKLPLPFSIFIISSISLVFIYLCMCIYLFYIFEFTNTPSSAKDGYILGKYTVLGLTKLTAIESMIHIEDQEKWDGKDQLLRLRGFFQTKNRNELIKIIMMNVFSRNDDMYFITGDDDEWWHKPTDTKNIIYLTRENFAQTENIKVYDVDGDKSIFLLESVSF